MMTSTIRSVADVPPIDRDERKPTGGDWRLMPAMLGSRCDSCDRRFRLGEVMLWNASTKLTVHQDCCSDPAVSFRPAPRPSTRPKAWSSKHLQS